MMVGLLLEDSHCMNDLQIVENELDQDDYKNQVVFSLHVSYHHLDNKSISHLIFLLHSNRVILFRVCDSVFRYYSTINNHYL